jgi:predicted lipid carrier protein YhbT
MAPAAQRIRVSRRRAAPAHDAAIRGDLAAFLAMLHGAEDGDALFFSGALEVSGDTSAVLALRNALDDAELDLTEELAAITGEPWAAGCGAPRTGGARMAGSCFPDRR